MTSELQIITTIDEIQGMLARLLTKRQVDKSLKVLEAAAKGRRVAESLGRMIEGQPGDHPGRQTREVSA